MEKYVSDIPGISNDITGISNFRKWYIRFIEIYTSNHMFKREIWDNITELTFYEVLKSQNSKEI